MEESILTIAVAVTVGATVSTLINIYRKIILRDKRAVKSGEKGMEPRKRSTKIIFSLTFLVLIIGLIWTVYYLVIGLLDRSLTEYATNVSQLIISVLTVFSIFIAFWQFFRDGSPRNPSD